jgi:biopolymer transport protein ExbD
MKRFRKALAKAEAGESGFDLNITSVIDCFTVLITYLLASASFLSIGSLDVSVASPSISSNSDAQSDTQLFVRVDASSQLRIELSGGEKGQWILPAQNGQVDLSGMRAQLKAISARIPSLKNGLVHAEGDVEYDKIVPVVSVAQEIIPSLSFGEPLKQ